MHQIDNTAKIIRPQTGEPLQFVEEDEGDESHDARPSDLIGVLVRQIPVETMGDADHGAQLLDMLRGEVGDVLNIEKADHEWLMKKVKAQAPKVFGLTAKRFEDALQPMSVAEKRKAKAKDKEPGD